MITKERKLLIQSTLNKKGWVVKNSHFLLKVFKSESPFSRFGVVVSGKVSKKAVERNRIRRMIFDFFRDKVDNFPIADYLVITNSSAIRLSKEEIRRELGEIMKKV